VFLLAAAESAAFLGLFVPGELAVILGGVAAGTGAAPLWVMILAAVGGAVAGDAVGYWLGRATGPRLLERPRMRKVRERLDQAADLLSRRGWWALVVARFASFLRAVVPFAAGLGRMAFRRFFLGNAIGGVLWGAGFTYAGYLAGARYATVERWIRTGGLAVVGVLAVVGGVIWAIRWVQRHPERVRSLAVRVSRLAPVRWVSTAARRVRIPAVALVIGGAVIVGGTWIFAGLLQDVLGTEEFFFFDLRAVSYLDAHPVSALVGIARLVHAAVAPPAVAVAALLWMMSSSVGGNVRRAVATASSVAGTWAIAAAAAALVDRTPPVSTPSVQVGSYGFPSMRVALFTALALAIVWPRGRGNWTRMVGRFGLAAIAAVIAASAEVLLVVAYPSDVLAAMAMASAWTVLSFVTARVPGDPGPGG
jgi:undecaprenyl-diphosphatase